MSSERRQPGAGYEILVQGQISPHRLNWLGNVEVVPQPDGVTLLLAPVMDQAALHGLLRALRDLGVPLISVLPRPAGAG